MTLAALQIQGNSSLIAVSSSTGQPATQISTASVTGAYVANPSTVPVYLAFGTSAVAASVPTTAVPSPGFCLPAGAVRPFNIGPSPINSQWLSAVTSAGAASIFATPCFSQ